MVATYAAADTIEISKDTYRDKCMGAWAGQMIGVCYGWAYEFKSLGKIIEGPLNEWRSDLIRDAIQQDDCYVEMTFLKSLETHGLDITWEQAGRDFGATEYKLWHANAAARANVRRGIMPPMSGNPKFNRHADDIDFQIEADVFGILCPGLPQESNRLCDLFGHIMNCGDGVYGGVFVAGMYAAAYTEDTDVRKVLDAGLACIPTESLYHQCISDVITWHAESPNDWRAVWHKIEEKWNDDIDCGMGHPINIDAKINGAYIAMGLLYGEGDLQKTLEVSTRCGQDADCNPSNAAGILGCMKGYSALSDWTDGFAEIENMPFAYTDYSFKALIPACEKITEAIVSRAGGDVTGDAYLVPVQRPVPLQPLEQWTNQAEMLAHPVPPEDMAQWNPQWKVTACGQNLAPGVRGTQYGRNNVLVISPVWRKIPAAIEATLAIPNTEAPKLTIDVASDEVGDFTLRVMVDGNLAKEQEIDTAGKWMTVEVDMKPYAGRTVSARIEDAANDPDSHFEAAYFDNVAVK